MKYKIIFIISIILIFSFISLETVHAVEPEIRAILFYSPTCPHCQIVITEVLPKLFEEYGNKLVIIGVDVSSEAGQSLYQSAITKYKIPEERYGVPTLIVGEKVLVGSAEIPEEFPSIISTGLDSGGIDWPDIAGLEEILIEQGLVNPDEIEEIDPIVEDSQSYSETDKSEKTDSTENTQPDQNSINSSEQEISLSNEEELSNTDEDIEIILDNNTGENSGSNIKITSNDVSGFYATMLLRFQQDVGGNTLAVIVLFFMIAGLFAVGIAYVTDTSFKLFHFPDWVIPLLAVFGLFVASYLSYIELTSTEAVCGPVGDCNTVQESPYAYLFGLIPIGVLGIVGYLAILIAWIIHTFGPISIRRFSAFAFWIMALVGVFFSTYLTFLEPFVIGATCAWCLTSAVTMTLILLASTQFIIEKDTSEFS